MCLARGMRSWSWSRSTRFPLAFAVAFLLVACAGCSSGNGRGSSGQSSAATFGTAPVQDQVAIADVSSALAELDSSLDVTREVRRCVRLRLRRDASLVERMSEGREGAVVGVVADCDQALSLASTFVSGVAGPDTSASLRECLRSLFVSMSATERVEVTEVVTGVGSGSEFESAAILEAGVEECRSGGG